MPLPTFVICGAPKAGTTSIYYYLSQHPEVCMSGIKETDYFQHNYEKGQDWFLSLYDHYQGEKAIGEASPGNMIHPEAPTRIHSLIPDAKLIFILREPIERAWSQYLFEIYRGTESPLTSFHRLISDPNNSKGRRIIELGMYVEQLDRYRRYFSTDQMLIFLYDDFKKDTEGCMKELFRFIGVAEDINIDYSEKKNVTGHIKHPTIYNILFKIWRPFRRILGNSLLERSIKFRGFFRDLMIDKNISSSAKKIPDNQSVSLLKSIYEKPNQALAEFLGKDLSHWEYPGDEEEK